MAAHAAATASSASAALTVNLVWPANCARQCSSDGAFVNIHGGGTFRVGPCAANNSAASVVMWPCSASAHRSHGSRGAARSCHATVFHAAKAGAVGTRSAARAASLVALLEVPDRRGPRLVASVIEQLDADGEPAVLGLQDSGIGVPDLGERRRPRDPSVAAAKRRGERSLERGRGVHSRAERDEVDVLAEAPIRQQGASQGCPAEEGHLVAMGLTDRSRMYEIRWSRRTCSFATPNWRATVRASSTSSPGEVMSRSTRPNLVRGATSLRALPTREIFQPRGIRAIRHLMFEDLGILQPLLVERGYAVRYLDAGIDDITIDTIIAADLLVVLGGPIGANDEDRYPFLTHELHAIATRVRAERPTLGICLGAQLLARALGAQVRTMNGAEIGYAPVTLTQDAEDSPLRHLHGVPVLHWHGDRFDLPAGAARLVSTPRCPHQAFTAGTSVLALQFHLETPRQDLERWLIGHGEALTAVGIHPEDIRRSADTAEPTLRRAAVLVFAEWLDMQPS